jgi:hypothetical protein
MRKTNFPNHHFRLATRGRSIQMGQTQSFDDDLRYVRLYSDDYRIADIARDPGSNSLNCRDDTIPPGTVL